MADFKTALQALSRGELKIEALIKNLEKLLERSPKLGDKILNQLRDAYSTDIIDAQTYATLKKRVQAKVGAETAPVGGDADEATQMAPADESDATQMLTESERAEIAEEARAATQMDITGGDSTVDFDLSLPNATTSDFDPTGSGATAGTAWAQPSQAAAEPLKIGPGAVLKERFELQDVLGVGGMGTVYRGIDLLKKEARDRNPYVALKVLNEDFKEHPDSFIALQREASRQQKLAHPNIATIYDFDRTGSTVYITMELMEGEPLNTYIKKTVRSRGGLPMEEAYPLIHGMGQGLIYAHERKIVHSDFKPGNCFLLKDGTMKILDFGIARAVKNPLAGEAEKTLFDPGKLGALTPAYASTEMLEGQDPDPRDDIYALACVAYELLTGKHPFNKLPANTARDNKLVPAPIKGLKRRQMKGLLRGLAFEREDRSQTVEQFLEELEGKTYWYKNPFVIAGAAAAIVALVGIPPTLTHLHNKKINSYIDDFSSLDSKLIKERLCLLPRLSCPDQPDIEKVSEDDQTRILADQEARDGIQGHYEAVIKANVDRRDYATAEKLLRDLRLLYPDSYKVQDIALFVEDNKNLLLSQLNERFNASLESGALLPDPQADDLGDVLREIKQVDPGHPLLADPRISAAYSKLAEKSIMALDFDRAQTIVDNGLSLIATYAPGKKDVNLVNLSDKIVNVREQEQQKAQVAAIESRLAEAEPNLKGFETWKPVQDDLARLAELAPDSELLASLMKKGRPVVEKEIASVRKDQDWARARVLKDDYATLLSAMRFDDELRQLDIARGEYERKVDKLLASLSTAVADNRLGPPAADNATDIVAQLAKAAPGGSRVAQARNAVARAYIRESRSARAAGDFDAAKKQLAAARKLNPGDAVAATLDAESKAIDEAQRIASLSGPQREQAEAERRARVAELTGELDQRIAALDGSVTSARKVFETLDQLEQADPTNPRVADARDKIVNSLTAAAKAAGDAGNWDKGLDAARDGLAMVPESIRLGETLTQLQANAQEALANAQQQLIADAQEQISELLASGSFNRGWDKALQSEYKKVAPLLPEDNPWLQDTSRQIGQIYAERAAQMREEQRFTEASRLLDLGENYVPGLESLASERQTLAMVQQEFERARQKELQQAELEGLKQTFLSQAKAREVKGAKETLGKLQSILDESDPFLKQQVPLLMGNAYKTLADKQAEKGNYLAALRLAKEGVEFAPTNASLKQAIQSYTVQGNAEELRGLFKKAEELDVADVQAKLNEVQLLNPSVHSKLQKDLVDIIAGRILALADPNPFGAQTLKNQALEIFPDNPKLSDLHIAIAAPPIVATLTTLVDQGRLSRAGALIKNEASDADKSHPSFQSEQRRLLERVRDAKAAAESADALRKAGKYEEALTAIKKAVDLWSDNRSYVRLREDLIKRTKPEAEGEAGAAATTPEEPTDDWIASVDAPSEQSCGPALAGHGSRKRGACYDYVVRSRGDKKKGPYMVVVPAGGNFAKPFAIGKYEVTNLDFSRYCENTKRCNINVTRENASLPVTGITLKQAEDYAKWLSARTGGSYRLPTAEEWLYAAEAGGDQPKKDYNCRLEQAGQLLKGQGLMSVNTGRPNGWGLYNYVGNAQEWTLGAGGTTVRGGMFKDSYSKCDISLERTHSGGADEGTSFRVVKDLG